MTSCPLVLMSAKSGAGDPSGGMEEGVAAQDADSDPLVTRTAPEDSAATAPRSRNSRRPTFLDTLCLLDLCRLSFSSLPRLWMEAIE